MHTSIQYLDKFKMDPIAHTNRHDQLQMQGHNQQMLLITLEKKTMFGRYTINVQINISTMHPFTEYFFDEIKNFKHETSSKHLDTI